MAIEIVDQHVEYRFNGEIHEAEIVFLLGIAPLALNATFTPEDLDGDMMGTDEEQSL